MGEAKNRGSIELRTAWAREVRLRDTEPRRAALVRQNGASLALLDFRREQHLKERIELERVKAAGPIELINGHYPFDLPRVLAENGLSGYSPSPVPRQRIPINIVHLSSGRLDENNNWRSR